MNKEIDLLDSLPKKARNIRGRKLTKSDLVVEEARKYGEKYFDGPREFGYGGYRYDGRWRTVARDIIRQYSLMPGNRVLDIGCAKGFLVKDLMLECPGLEAFGIDVSEYALKNCEPEVIGRLQIGNAVRPPFPDDSFDLVVSINTLHNLNRQELLIALKEIQRITKQESYIVVDSFRTPQQKEIFEDWVLTAKFYDYPAGWKKVFEEAGYLGDYSWTIIE